MQYTLLINTVLCPIYKCHLALNWINYRTYLCYMKNNIISIVKCWHICLHYIYLLVVIPTKHLTMVVAETDVVSMHEHDQVNFNPPIQKLRYYLSKSPNIVTTNISSYTIYMYVFYNKVHVNTWWNLKFVLSIEILCLFNTVHTHCMACVCIMVQNTASEDWSTVFNS